MVLRLSGTPKSSHMTRLECRCYRSMTVDSCGLPGRFEHLGSNVIACGTCHEEWATRRKAAREPVGALRKGVLVQSALSKKVRATVADAVCGGRLFFAEGTLDMPTKEVAAQTSLRVCCSSPVHCGAEEQGWQIGAPWCKAKISVERLRHAARVSVSPCALAALLGQVGGRSRVLRDANGLPTTLHRKLQSPPAPAKEADLAEWERFWIRWLAQWTMLTRKALKVNAETLEKTKTEAKEGFSGGVVLVDEKRPWACQERGKTWLSKKQVAQYHVSAHGKARAVRKFISSTQCPVCATEFWEP